jgi:hypothetical protein
MKRSRVVRAVLATSRVWCTGIAMTAFLACASMAQAQTPTTPAASDTVGKAMTNLMQSMLDQQVARMAQVMNATMTARIAVLAKPETAQQLATFIRNLYDALIAKGFAKDEALRIVAGFSVLASGSSSSGS